MNSDILYYLIGTEVLRAFNIADRQCSADEISDLILKMPKKKNGERNPFQAFCQRRSLNPESVPTMFVDTTMEFVGGVFQKMLEENYEFDPFPLIGHSDYWEGMCKHSIHLRVFEEWAKRMNVQPRFMATDETVDRFGMKYQVYWFVPKLTGGPVSWVP